MFTAARSLIIGAIATAVVSVVSGVFANPAGEIVVHGDVTFDRSNTGQLNILQGSNRGIIHWNDFSIANGELTRFNQPGANAATLNRIISSLPSRIDGKLSANGQIFLINPNGIVVGPSGRVDASSFVASTLDVPDNAFLSGGDMRFSGSSRAAVVNHGTITAIGGDVFLLGAHVENHGRISAPNGTAGLGAGQDILLRQAGSDERLFIKPAGGNKGGTGITNTGTIEAARAELKAHGNVYALAINNSGMIRATGAARKNGRVLLGAPGGKILHSGTITARNANGSGGEVRIDATPDGEIVATGSIDASGQAGSGTPGGDVVMAAARIELSGSASADASGDTGGGMIRIGGGPQGGDPSIENASEVIVGPGVHLSADARRSGDGGSVIVWSDGSTLFEGTISAQALGPNGNGGFAEVSGLQSLDYKGLADLRAASGATGTLLLDPTDATIDAPTAANIEANLVGAHVIFSTNAAGGDPGNISIDAPINSNSPNTLGIFGHGDVLVNNNITLPNGRVGFVAGWDGITENPGGPGLQTVGGVNFLAFFSNPATYGNNNHSVVINAPVQANVAALAGDGITQNGDIVAGMAVALAHRQPYNQAAGQLNSPFIQIFDTGDFGAMTNTAQLQFANKTGGNINVINQSAVGLSGNFNSPGGFLFQTLAGNVNLDPGLGLVSGGIPPVTIAAGQNLINNAGAGVFGGSNFAIFTQGPGGDADGGLLGFAAQQFNSPFPTLPLNPQSFLYPGPAPVVPLPPVPVPGGGGNNRPGRGGPNPGPFIGPAGPPDLVDIEIDPATFVFPIFPENFFDPTFAGNTERNFTEIPSFSSGDEISVEFAFGDKIAPRLGASYDLTGDGKVRISGETDGPYKSLFGDDPRDILFNPGDPLVGFSSRGPRFGDGFMIKPDVTAPGVNIFVFPPGPDGIGLPGSTPALGGAPSPVPDTRSELQREMDIRRKLRAGDPEGIGEAADHIRDKYPDNEGPEPGQSTVDWLREFEEIADALNDFFIRQEADIKARLRAGDPEAPGDAWRHLRRKGGRASGPLGAGGSSAHDTVKGSTEFGDAFEEWKRKEVQRINDLLEAGDPEGIRDAVRYLRFTRTATRSGRLGATTTREKLLSSPFAEAVRAYEAKQEADIKKRLAAGDVTAAADALRLIRWQRPSAARSGSTPPKSDYDTLAGSERFGDLIKALDREEVEAALAEAKRQAEIAYLERQIESGRTIFTGGIFLYDEATRAAYEKAFSALEEHRRHLESPDSIPRPANPLTQAEIDRLDGVVGFQVIHYLGDPAPPAVASIPDLGSLNFKLIHTTRILEGLPGDQVIEPGSDALKIVRFTFDLVNETMDEVAKLAADGELRLLIPEPIGTPPEVVETPPDLARAIEDVFDQTEGGDSWRGTPTEAQNTIDIAGEIVRVIRESLRGGESEPDVLDAEEIKRRLANGDKDALVEMVRWWDAHPEVPPVNGWPQGFEDARQAFIDWWKKNLEERLRNGDKTALDDWVWLLEEFTFGTEDLDESPTDIELWREWGLEEARQAFIDWWVEDIRRRLRNGDKTALVDLKWLAETFTFGTQDVNNPDRSDDPFVKFGLEEDRQAFIDWWVDDINRRLANGEEEAIADMIWLAEFAGPGGVRNVSDPDPGQKFIDDKFTGGLDAFREKLREDIRKRLEAGDESALADMHRYANFFAPGGVYSWENDPVYWIIEDEFREALDKFIAKKIADIDRRLRDGDDTALEDLVKLVNFTTRDGAGPIGEDFLGQFVDEHLREAYDEWVREKIAALRERLRNGDTSVFEEIYKLGATLAPGGTFDIGDDWVDDWMKNTFGRDFRLFNIMVESDVRSRLRKGDPKAVADAARHLVWKGIDIGGTPEENRQAILNSKEFGDPAAQFERTTGTKLDAHCKDVVKKGGNDPRAGTGPVDYR